MTYYEGIDPETGKVVRIVLERRGRRTSFRRLKESIFDTNKMSSRELEARAAFALGASRGFGQKVTDGQHPCWAPIREEMAKTMRDLPDPKRDKVREERARVQEKRRAMLPPEVRDEIAALATDGAPARSKKRRRQLPVSSHPSLDTAGGPESIPKPPFWY